MEEFSAHYSRWRLALIFLSAVGFVAIGLQLAGVFGEPTSLAQEPRRRRLSHDETVLIGWLTVLFFGYCGIKIGAKFFDESVQLQVGRAGIRWIPWSAQLIPWSEIRDVTTWRYKGQATIVLHLRQADRFPGRGLAAKLSAANRKLTGGDISISLAGTNRSYSDAMEAIGYFRNASGSSEC